VPETKTRRLPSSWVAPLLAAPLVGLSAWVVQGALRPPPVSPASPAAVAAEGPLPGLPRPTADLPAERLEEQVDGAAEALRAHGCRRLLHWSFAEPTVEAELLVFETVEGARAVMAGEAGPERTAGPGEEAQVAAQFACFRRENVFVRLFSDPASARPGEDLARRAAEIDRALVSGGPL
jgi:hypothetical protein